MKLYQVFESDYILCFQAICNSDEELIKLANEDYSIDLTDDESGYWFETLEELNGFKLNFTKEELQ